MTNSIPGGVTAIDTIGDGLVNTFFAADTAGQVWRFDLNTEATEADELASGGVIADIAGDTAASARRFFYRPDVSLVSKPGGYALAVAIGSGYRPHPLEMVSENRFYVLFDQHPFSKPTSYSAVGEDDLTDLTDNGSSGSLSAGTGWYIRLGSGEKSLSESRTIDGVTMFSTYTPSTSNDSVCSPGLGLGRFYAVNASSAQPAYVLGVSDLDEIPGTVNEARSTELTRGGIPPEPTIIFPKDGGKPVVIVGTEVIDDAEPENVLRRLSWFVE
jgi:type IV pilus assembly protein PilY1